MKTSLLLIASVILLAGAQRPGGRGEVVEGEEECVLTVPDQPVLTDPSQLPGEASRPALRDLLRPVLTAALRRDPRDQDDQEVDREEDLEDVQVEDLEEDPGEDLALRRKLRLLTLNDPYFPKLNFQ